MFKRSIGYVVSWLCYTLGDIISYPMYYVPWGLFSWVYPAYNNLMGWSLKVEAWAGITYKWFPVKGGNWDE